jgi:hypothetical protein
MLGEERHQTLTSLPKVVSNVCGNGVTAFSVKGSFDLVLGIDSTKASIVSVRLLRA